MSDFLLAEGFGNLSDGTHTAGSTREILGDQWPGYGQNFIIVDRGDGRKWLKVLIASRPQLQSKAFSDPSTFSICFRIYRYDAGQHVICRLMNASGTIGWITINSVGAVGYNIGSAGTAADTTTIISNTLIEIATDKFVEMRFVLGDGAAGSVAFYINGVLSNTVSGIDTCYGTGRTSLRSIIFGDAQVNGYGLRGGWKYGDIIVHTAAAGIGDVGVYYRPSDADGTDTDFTPSAGDNFECVDEIGPDEDTTYNESDGTAGHRDSFETPGVSAMSVLSVGVLVRARKTDSGAATLLVGAVHGGSEDQSSARNLAESYLTYSEFFDVCPSTSAAWSAAEVTAAELSYEVGA